MKQKKTIFAVILAVALFALLESLCVLVVKAFDRDRKLSPIYQDFTTRERAEAYHRELTDGPQFDPDLSADNSIPCRHPDELKAGSSAIASVHGDSFTFAQHVPYEKGWPYLAGTFLEKPVINCGVSGFGPDLALIKFIKYRNRFPAPVAALGILPENVNRCLSRIPNYYFHHWSKLPESKLRFVIRDDAVQFLPNPCRSLEGLMQLLDPDYLRELSHDDYWYLHDLRRYGYDRIARRPRSFPYTWEATRIAYGLLRYPGETRADYIRFYRDEQSEGMRIMRHIVLEFVRKAHSFGAAPLIIVHCGPGDLKHHADIMPFIQWMRGQDIIVADLIDVVRQEIDSGRYRHEDLYIPVDAHYSVVANWIVARRMAPLFDMLARGNIEEARQYSETLPAPDTGVNMLLE